jgi:phage tail protein X
MAKYLTKNGDTLDYICWKHYGQQSGAVEQVFEANPGLADAGTILTAGTVIELPALTVTNKSNTISLWD